MSPELADQLYSQLALDMRVLYRQCRLVHADLSEYNMILHRECSEDDQQERQVLYMIDVSQSVEHDHPHSMDFLRTDIANVTRWFRSAEASVLSMRQLFQLITDPAVETDKQVEHLLSLRSTEGPDDDDDALFMGAFIAQKLDHVLHFERDVAAQRRGDEVNNPYETMISGVRVRTDSTVDTEATSTVDESEAPMLVDSVEIKESKPSLHAHDREESPNSRKERKRLVKAEQRENRLHKTPKHVKKRHEKSNKK